MIENFQVYELLYKTLMVDPRLEDATFTQNNKKIWSNDSFYYPEGHFSSGFDTSLS